MEKGTISILSIRSNFSVDLACGKNVAAQMAAP